MVDANSSVYEFNNSNHLGTSVEIKIKTFLMLACNPLSILLIACGLIFGFLSAQPVVMIVGILLGLLCSAGAVASEFSYVVNKQTEQAERKIVAKTERDRERELDSLDRRLVNAKGPEPHRDQTYLRELRSLYKNFLEDVRTGMILQEVQPETMSQIDAMFEACVSALNHSYVIWHNASAMKGKAKKKLLKDRENVIDEVGKSVQRFSDTLEMIRSCNLKPNSSELQRLRRQLRDSLEIAKRTDERLYDLGVDLDKDFQ